jgi:hypothetical protein
MRISVHAGKKLKPFFSPPATLDKGGQGLDGNRPMWHADLACHIFSRPGGRREFTTCRSQAVNIKCLCVRSCPHWSSEAGGKKIAFALPCRLDKLEVVRYILSNSDTGGMDMPISLRIPPKKEELISLAAKKAGKTKTAFILDAVDEKLHLVEKREQIIRKTAGWLNPEEGSELKKDLKVFETIDDADWQ